MTYRFIPAAIATAMLLTGALTFTGSTAFASEHDECAGGPVQDVSQNDPCGYQGNSGKDNQNDDSDDSDNSPGTNGFSPVTSDPADNPELIALVADALEGLIAGQSS